MCEAAAGARAGLAKGAGGVVREQAEAEALASGAVAARGGRVLEGASLGAVGAREAVAAGRGLHGAAVHGRGKVLLGHGGGQVGVVAIGAGAVGLELAGDGGVREAARGAERAVREVAAQRRLLAWVARPGPGPGASGV